MFKTKLLATALTAAACIGLAALSGPARADEPTVGLAVANLQANFFNQIKQSVEAEAKLKGVKVIVVDAHGDSATQVNQIQDLITRGVKAIIYIPAGATAAGVPVKAAEAAHIPVVAVDRNAPDAPADTFIATNSVDAAHTLGDYVCKISGGTGTLGELPGHPSRRQAAEPGMVAGRGLQHRPGHASASPRHHHLLRPG
jgi:ribose transport system substrate-binding protein